MAHRYKVIHVIGGGEFGGAEEHIIRLVSRLDGHGLLGKVVCFYDAEFARALRELNIEVEVLRYGRFDIRLVAALKQLFMRESPMIVHTHGVKANFFARLASRRLTGFKRLTTVHSLLRHDYANPIAYSVANWMEKSTRRYNDHFIAVSGAIRDSLLAEHVPANKITVVHHGIDLHLFENAAPSLREELGIGGRSYVIGAVARLVKIKAMDTLIRALRIIREREPEADARLVIVGTGPEEQSLRRLAGELGLARAVHFTGFRRDIPACLASFDCFASASLSEGLGLNILEAMAAGVPVVATGVGGVLDIVRDGETGLLVRPLEPDKLADGVLALMRDPALAERLASAARQRVRDRFSLERMVSDTVGLYDALLDGRHVQG
jgi:glycosyltransferase involved in cell wall biosynthesis